MVQESFVYSFVARGTTVLAEHFEVTGDFPAVAVHCLQKLASSSNKFTYRFDGHVYNFLTQHGCVYCVVAKDTVGQQLSSALIERIQADFRKKYGGGKADTAATNGLNKEFGPVMKEHMKYVDNNADEIDKVAKLQNQVSAVKNVMFENLDKALGRGEILTDLSEKANDLRDSARTFQIQGTQLKRKLWYQNMKMKLVIIGILILLVLIIWLSICRGFVCNN